MQAGTWVKGPLKQLGGGPQSLGSYGSLLLSVDGVDAKLYEASTPALDKLNAEPTIGQFGNHLLVEGSYAYVVNSGSGTLQILQASGGVDPVEGVAMTTVGEVQFGQNTFPQVAVKVGNKVYVTLLGGFGTAASAGQKVVDVDVTDPAHPMKGTGFDLTPLALKTFTSGASTFPRPQGITAKDGNLYVALNNTDASYAVAGPGYLAVIPLDGGAMRAVELPSDKCVSPVWVAPHAQGMVLSCAGNATYDANYKLLSVAATGVALVKADDSVSALSLSCPMGDDSCMPPMMSRFTLHGDDIVLGDQNGGRIFIVGVQSGALVEKLTPGKGNSLNVCPVGMAGFSNVADILSVP
jgi:hypothetical protein